jgi:hypothetical protein
MCDRAMVRSAGVGVVETPTVFTTPKESQMYIGLGTLLLIIILIIILT